MRFKHIFFDLDHTLWDFEGNARQTLTELFNEYKLAEMGIPDARAFITTYKEINKNYWELYRQHLVSKSTLRIARFKDTFTAFGIPEGEMPLSLPEYFIEHGPLKSGLMPNAMEILEYLQPKYTLHIVTNGFVETQVTKMKSSNILHFFDKLIFSEQVQAHKPNPLIFEHALKEAGTTAGQSVFIGDHLEADILGSRNVGLTPVFYNPENTPHNEILELEISDLIEIKNHF